MPLRAIPDPVSSFNIKLSIVVNESEQPLGPVQEDGPDVFKSRVIPDVCRRAYQCLKSLDLAILQAVIHQTKDSEIARTVIWRIGWDRNSDESRVFKVGHDLLAIVTPRIAHVKEKIAT
jgi:hypothetical protein